MDSSALFLLAADAILLLHVLFVAFVVAGLVLILVGKVRAWFDDNPIRDEYLIVEGGKLAGVGAHSYSEGDATGGSEEAARFKEGK